MTTFSETLPTYVDHDNWKIPHRSAAGNLESADLEMKDRFSDDSASLRHATRLIPDVRHCEEVTSRPQGKGGVLGFVRRCMEVLVTHGVEERGIIPRPEDVSYTLDGSFYIEFDGAGF